VIHAISSVNGGLDGISAMSHSTFGRESGFPPFMAKGKSVFVCQNCGAITRRWQGKCETCGEWNTIVEEAAVSGVGAASRRVSGSGRPFALENLKGGAPQKERIVTGLK
jgi:predicted ATP-dependent serine protease